MLAGHPEGLARVIEGLMTGIGFIGGGSIIINLAAPRWRVPFKDQNDRAS